MKRPQTIALAVVVLVTLVVLNLPTQTMMRLKMAVSSLFLPLFGLAGATHQALARVPDAFTTRGELARQNEQLRRENAELRVLARLSQDATRENQRLRELLAWQRTAPPKLRLARVVSRDPANWWRTVQIDLGARDGLRADLPVMTTEGLVGRISEVSLATARVVLLGDPNCRVSALVENERRDSGVLGTAGLLDSDLVALTYLPRAADVKPGQAVVTSGLGGVFPKGISIGKVMDVRPVEYGLYAEARVKLGANLGGLEEVWVVMP